MKHISILGCGWLGLPFAERLTQKGYKVKGSTTSEEKLPIIEQKGIQPFLINLKNELSQPLMNDFLSSDILLINIPPSRSQEGGKSYMDQLKSLIPHLKQSSISKIIFISTTAAYASEGKVVTEKDEQRITSPFSDIIWLDAEEIFTLEDKFDTTVVRFSGLIGGSYQPGKYFSGKEMKGADEPVNMIHLTDCLNIIEGIIERNLWNETYNASSDEHPSRREFYTKACETAGTPAPIFIEGHLPYRIVNSDKIKKALDYHFVYPNPMDGLGI
ncbi:SDR family NAD(P)-dependent oxidoreductase [Aureibacter tunicatorum]|uniref:Nucleoside-diphosphate-sugar epimerase n=1 Tax=Aureibacter tunicatorum TaxID=866807 RepID=A0AAE4BNS4_9BACT|nr:SDR family NAD(P)-dependent oxidoreductase [Aureibacter tunicatorum]MDR6237144.1 nucleoside-diphosphate-sugar epimerase [Aureibacter tunicatorum]BDD06136.1 NAD(P)-dependent oxidoreductase [Aureibacter tunicatorum]